MPRIRPASEPQPRWWDARRAQNRKPATYRCPLCGELLPALSEHMLLFPEGDHSRRRHAHTVCVMRARAAGRLPSRDEWERGQRDAGGQQSSGVWQRLRRLIRPRM
jgi:hypothetical protein